MKRIWSMFTGLSAFLLLAPAAIASEGHAAGGIQDPVELWNHLWYELMVDLWVIGIFFGSVALYWLFKYKANSSDEVGSGPKLSVTQSLMWAIIPALVFMADDFYLAANGWTVWNVYRNVPENALEVKVTGSQWSWDFEYEGGVETDELKVPEGRPVVLRMSSEDVIHSFFMPKYRVKEDLMPGRITYLWFYPKDVGKTFVTCTEFCGTDHAEMSSDVIVVPEAEFNAWLASEQSSASASREKSSDILLAQAQTLAQVNLKTAILEGGK